MEFLIAAVIIFFFFSDMSRNRELKKLHYKMKWLESRQDELIESRQKARELVVKFPETCAFRTELKEIEYELKQVERDMDNTDATMQRI